MRWQCLSFGEWIKSMVAVLPHLKVVTEASSQILKLCLNLPRPGVIQDAHKPILEREHGLGIPQNLLAPRPPLCTGVNPKVVVERVNLQPLLEGFFQDVDLFLSHKIRLLRPNVQALGAGASRARPSKPMLLCNH